jgi:hypothetical protein
MTFGSDCRDKTGSVMVCQCGTFRNDKHVKYTHQGNNT